MYELLFYLSDPPIAPYSDDFDNKWHLTIKHPKRISSEPHILPFKFATDAVILHVFEGYWAKYTSWMEVLERYMPSWRVKIEFEMVRGLREGEGFTLQIHILQEETITCWLRVYEFM